MLWRALALVGAALITASVTGRAWWYFAGGSELFADHHGYLGPYTGTWCSDVFCHDLESDRAGAAFDVFGVVVFFAGLATVHAIVMTLLARDDKRAFAKATALLGAITAAASIALVVVRREIGAHHELDLGLPVALAGLAFGVLGAWRAPSISPRRRPVLGAILVGLACAIALPALLSKGFWSWSWSDERNRVGLTTSERCWEHPSRTVCSERADVAEMFMLDRRDNPRFMRTARHTQHAGFAAIVLAIVALLVARMREHAHAVWIVLGVLSLATLAMTPDMGRARDPALGYAFVLVWIACLLGITGHVLSRDATESGRPRRPPSRPEDARPRAAS